MKRKSIVGSRWFYKQNKKGDARQRAIRDDRVIVLYGWRGTRASYVFFSLADAGSSTPLPRDQDFTASRPNQIFELFYNPTELWDKCRRIVSNQLDFMMHSFQRLPNNVTFGSKKRGVTIVCDRETYKGKHNY